MGGDGSTSLCHHRRVCPWSSVHAGIVIGPDVTPPPSSVIAQDVTPPLPSSSSVISQDVCIALEVHDDVAGLPNTVKKLVQVRA